MRPRTLLITFSVAVLLAATVNAQTSASPANAPRPENYYSAGSHVDISAPMPGDVVVAGRQIDIRQTVSGDILAAGWHVALSGRADDDVRMAGAQVDVNAPVRGDLTIAGRDVTVGAQTQVEGRSWITGQTVRIDGTFDRELEIAGATVQIAGETRRPVRIIADRLEVLPEARLLAPISYKGTTEMHVANGAVINGPVTFERIPEREARRARSFPTTSTVIFTLHLFFAGVLVLLMAPRAEQSVVDVLRLHPGKSVLLGVMLLVTTPIAALLLVVSVIGLPLGFALAAVYGLAIFAGLLTTAFCVGDLEARWFTFGPVLTRGQHALLLLAGVLTIAVLRSVLGGVVVFACVVFGLGALTLTAHDRFVRRPMTTASA